jgi:predicted permease
VVAVAAAVCLAATLLFGLVPALQTSRFDLAGALRAESGGVVGARGRNRVRSILVLVQVALGFVLLVGAGLLVRSVRAIGDARPGFSTRGVLATVVDLFPAGYTPERARMLQDEIAERVSALPGVTSAAFSRLTPFTYRTYSSAPIAVEGYVPPPGEQPTADYNEVGPGFLATLGIPLVSGREFTRADDGEAPRVAVVDETMAARFWPGADPVGQRLKVGDRWMDVVGVARTAKYRNLLETPKPFFYVPLRQNVSVTAALLVRTDLPTAAFAPALARIVRALAPGVAPGEIITMAEQVRRTTASQRIAVTILGVFGGLALLLSAVGLYGVMAAAVAQSRREHALRMALGAGTADLLKLVMSRGLALAGAGILLGAAAALATTRLMGYLLYRVGPRDPLAFATAFAVVAAAALLACLGPAWRAARTDPVEALRG